jgi:hypothetical protein
MASNQWGRYVLVRAVGPCFEFTNIGVIVFGPDGKQVAARMDTPDRAIRRGDLPANVMEDDVLLSHLERYPEAVPDMETLHRVVRTTGHAMSFVQLSDARGAMMRPGMVDELFDRLVLGKVDQ